MSDFTDRLAQYRKRVDTALEQRLPDTTDNSTQLQQAMRYAMTNGGKRIRPVLMYATGVALGLSLEKLDVAACSVEMMHGYSLIHDDLPAMDDDDLRRGLPTLHVEFDEATAILAGDALQALAFTVLATNPDASLSADVRLKMITVLGDASGAHGMAAGQAIDLESVGKKLTLAQLEDMHRRWRRRQSLARRKNKLVRHRHRRPPLCQQLQSTSSFPLETAPTAVQHPASVLAPGCVRIAARVQHGRQTAA